MKKSILLILTLALFVSCQEDECTENVCVERITYLRTNVTTIDLGGMNSDLTINAQSDEVADYITTGDVNLNGYELKLINVKLTVVGNLNGSGVVKTNGESTVCVQGNIQNNPEYNTNDFTCGSLSSGGVGSISSGPIEIQCGEFLVGDTFRNGNYWYEVVECY